MHGRWSGNGKYIANKYHAWNFKPGFQWKMTKINSCFETKKYVVHMLFISEIVFQRQKYVLTKGRYLEIENMLQKFKFKLKTSHVVLYVIKTFKAASVLFGIGLFWWTVLWQSSLVFSLAKIKNRFKQKKGLFLFHYIVSKVFFTSFPASKGMPFHKIMIFLCWMISWNHNIETLTSMLFDP